MLKQLLIVLSVLSKQFHTNAASNDVNNEKNIETNLKLDDKLYQLADIVIDNQDTLTAETREKRFYDFIGYNTGSSPFSSIYPNIPNYNERDGARYTVSGDQYRLNEIIKRLQSIADITKRQYLPPTTQPNIPFPAYFPYIFIPPTICGCNQPNADNTPHTTSPASTSLPEENTKGPSEETTDTLGTRFGTSENTTNTTFSDPPDYDDGVRPISFDPIPPKRPLSVPLPPVEHGSSQAGAETSSPPNLSSGGSSVQRFPTNDQIPSVCDGAILTCCHRPIVTLNCFAKEGCDNLPYDNPCIPNVLSKIVLKFRLFYQQRKG